jgi:hypothetical protein
MLLLLKKKKRYILVLQSDFFVNQITFDFFTSSYYLRQTNIESLELLLIYKVQLQAWYKRIYHENSRLLILFVEQLEKKIQSAIINNDILRMALMQEEYCTSICFCCDLLNYALLLISERVVICFAFFFSRVPQQFA